jgi:anti-sigma regulatory factor (Ser/Thr protein kinase)
MALMTATSAGRKVARQRDRLFLAVPAAPEHVRTLRSAAAEYLRRLNWSEREIGDFILAIGEAGNNAACYGAVGGHGAARGSRLGEATISLECRLSGDRSVVMEIRNRGTFSLKQDTESSEFPDWREVHGRGFALMRALVDHVEVCQADGITTVRLVKSKAR